MSQSSRGKSSERVANTSYHSSQGVTNAIAHNTFINQINGHNSSSNTLKDARDPQQKDLITEMKRLKKNFQELKSPTVQKKYFGVTSGIGIQQQQQSSQISILNEHNEQYNNHNNQQYNHTSMSQDQYNSDQFKAFANQKGYFNENQRQTSQTRVKANYNQNVFQQNTSLTSHVKGQLSDSNRNHYISQEEDISGDQDNNQNYLNQFDKSINQSFNQNTSVYSKTLIAQQQQGCESNRSYNGVGSLNNSGLNQHGYNIQQQQNIPRGSQKEYGNSLLQSQQQLQSRQNNSLKRISDKINNIKDRAEKIEQIKHFEKKSQLMNNQQGILVQKDTKESQTEDISNIFIEKRINDQNILEIERLREQLKTLEQELDSKEKTFREQEKQLQSQIDEKKNKIQDQNEQIEKVLDDLNRLQKENIKVNNALKQAQENLALNGKNQNNTSSQHLLPSEFKTKWESLVTDGVANTFINFFENPLILTNLLQDLFIIIHEVSKNHIKETNSKVMDLLQLDKKHAKVYEQNLSKLYQDYNNDIFKVVADIDHPKVAAIISKFKSQADKIVGHQYFSEFQNQKSDYIDEEEDYEEQEGSSGSSQKVKKMNIFRETLFFEQNQEDFKQYLQELYESSELLEFIEQFYRLSIHMHLHDPSLNLPVQNFKNRVFEYIPYKKNNYYLIDGFVQQNAPALTIIPSVMRNNQIYTGIKPSVILLTEEFMNERIQSKIDLIIQNEESQYNSTNPGSQKCNQSGDKNESSKTNSQTKDKEENLKEKYESPKQPLKAAKEDTNILNKKNETDSQNKDNISSEKNKNIIQEKQLQINKENIVQNKQNEDESTTQNYLKLSCEKKKTDPLVNNYCSSSKDNKENQEQYINQAQTKMKSPNTQCMNNLKNISQVSQKFESSSKKSGGYLNFGYISTSPKQDLLNLISPKGSSSKKIKIENLDSNSKVLKNNSKLQEVLSNSSKKKLNFDSFHSDKKLGINSNKSGIGSPVLENCKDEIVKNLFLTSRHHYSSNTKQRDDSQNSNLNFSVKSGWQLQHSSQNQQDAEKRSIFDDLTNQTVFKNNIPGQISKQQPQKFINRLDNSNFLKKGSFTSKNKSSISSHMNNTYLNSMIHKQTQDSVQLLKTLQVDSKKNHTISKEEQHENDEVEILGQNDDKNNYNSKSKNISINKKQNKESNSPISNKNNKNLNDSKLNFSNAAINSNDQERSRIHSNNQSSSKVRKHNKSEEENRIINQNTIFNKHFKKNSVQNDIPKNQNAQQSTQQTSSKPYTFNTFLENHRKNLQKSEKEQSVNYQQDSSPRERVQSKALNISFKDQQNKQMANSSRLYKKDSFELKSSNCNHLSFSRQNQEVKQNDKNKFSNNDFYSNLRKQISNHQSLGGIQNESYEQQSKDNSRLPLKSSRDISPSQVQLNCSKTDRLLKYQDQNQVAYDSLSHLLSQKPSNNRTISMKRALQNIINSFSSDENEEENIQTQVQKQQRDSDYIQDDSLIDELNLQKNEQNLNRQLSSLNKNNVKGESNENRPFSYQSGLHIQPQHKKNKTFEKLYNDLKQKKPFLQNPVKPSKDLSYKI